MKILFFASLVLCAIITVPAFGAGMVGISSQWPIDIGSQKFTIDATSNFDITDLRFDLEEKILTIDFVSSAENNLAEIIIPKQILDEQLSVTLDDQKYLPDIRSNKKTWFITTKFNGTGMHTLVIRDSTNKTMAATKEMPVDDNGCLIATAAYGSEMSPQVQMLREIRDDVILQTESGSAFMSGFNQFYYSFSPTIADMQRQNPIFKEAVKITITPLLASLSILNHIDIDSEHEMLGVGIGIIMINVGMYLGPVIGIIVTKKYVSFKQ